VTGTAVHPWPLLDVLSQGAAPECAAGDVLYLHGFGEQGADLREFVGRTLPDGAAARLPTLRGHGQGARPSWGYTPSDFAADLQRTFTDLHRHAVVGFSFGGIVASAYALAVGPERVSGLVVLDQAFESRPERTETGEWAEAVHMKWQYDYTHHLRAAAAVGIPVLLVHADDSQVVGEAERAAWRSGSVPGLQVVAVPGGHADLVRGNCTAACVTGEFLSGLHDAEGRT